MGFVEMVAGGSKRIMMRRQADCCVSAADIVGHAWCGVNWGVPRSGLVNETGRSGRICPFPVRSGRDRVCRQTVLCGACHEVAVLAGHGNDIGTDLPSSGLLVAVGGRLSAEGFSCWQLPAWTSSMKPVSANASMT